MALDHAVERFCDRRPEYATACVVKNGSKILDSSASGMPVPVSLIATLMQLQHNANEIIHPHDLDGNLTSINRAGERLSNYSRQPVRTDNGSYCSLEPFLLPSRREDEDTRGRVFLFLKKRVPEYNDT
jgi:hypothetical protein